MRRVAERVEDRGDLVGDGRPAGGTRSTAGSTMYSAKQPGRFTPTPWVLRHRWRRPARQLRQWPQVMWPSPETRSPTARPRTSLPDGDDLAAVLVADLHRHRDRALRPGVPLPDVDVGAADRGLAHADQHVVRARLGLRQLAEPDPGLRPRLDQCLHGCLTCRSTPSSRPAWTKAVAAVSSIARVWLAHICVRMRALPIGTTGYEKPIAYTPSSSRRSAMRTASAASPIITGMIGCSPGSSRNPAAASCAPEPGRVRRELLARRGRGLEEVEHRERRRRDHRRDGVREEVGPRALAQPGDDRRATGHVAAARAAERLAERAGQHVDASHDAAVLVRAAPARAHEPGRVRVVDDDGRAVAVGELADAGQRRDRAVHREHAVGHDEARARALGLAQPGFELAEVAVVVAQALRLRQADAVDDARVVERVRDDRVLLAGQRLEQAAVGVEAGRVEDGVLGAEEGREPALELAVHGLGPADEAHRGHAVAVAVERGVGRGDDRRVVREPEVVVGAEVQHLAAVLEADHGILRRGDDALALEEPRARELRRLGFEPIEQGLVHAFAHRGQRRIIPAARAAPRIIAAGRQHESNRARRAAGRGASEPGRGDRRLARGAAVHRAHRALRHQRPDRRVRRRQDLRARGHARPRALRLAAVRAEAGRCPSPPA